MTGKSSLERVWVLGSPDPEMERTEELLRECGEAVVHAIADGRRVNSGNAYQADDIFVENDDTVVYFVECDAKVVHSPSGDRIVGQNRRRVDHHRPGDPGYGRSPEDFLPASSIGQVISELARLGALRELSAYWDPFPAEYGPMVWLPPHRPSQRWAIRVHLGDRTDVWAKIPQDLVLAAAADHCLGAAYRGECPGVGPGELMRWRVETRANFQGRTFTEVAIDIERAKSALRNASYVTLGWYCRTGGHLSDRANFETRGVPEETYWERYCVVCGMGGVESVTAADMRSDRPVPELPEAALRLDVPYVSGPLVGADGSRKYTCSGRSEVVRAFLDHWAPSQGLAGLYGDPQRGFAGGYDTSDDS